MAEKKHRFAQQEETVGLSQIVFDLAGTIFLSLTVLLLVMTYFVRQVTVDGPSMNQTLQDQDRLLVSCFQYQPKTGDVVVVTHGQELSEPIIKRVIAVGGQTLSIDFDTGDVIVDGVLLKEPYIQGITTQMSGSGQIPAEIPEGYVFVMGDNRQNSLDSRSQRVGLVPVENIVGKAFFRIYPMDQFGEIQ